LLRTPPTGAWLEQLDVEHPIEELEGLMSGEKSAVVTLATRTMEHLLCLQHGLGIAPRKRW
jgi:hypothetical protein